MTLSNVSANVESSDANTPMQGRITLDLDGIWELASGGEVQPDAFPGTVCVPGLVDLAEGLEVEFSGAETTAPCWWYRKKCDLPASCDRAVIEVDAARYGVSCWFNGTFKGRHVGGWTRARFDLGPLASGAHEIVLRVDARRELMAKAGLHNGHDCEKYRYIPGICDSVRLIASATAYILELQTAPDPDREWVLVEALVVNTDSVLRVIVSHFEVFASDGKTWTETLAPVEIPPYSTIPIRACVRCPGILNWSPDSPVLHHMRCDLGTDAATVRFGMRRFRFDPVTKLANLNGKTLWLRGTNVCMDRFFEDPLRARLPWTRDWVRLFIRQCRWMNWNSVRFTIGSPPDLWYDICDEEGLLVQDEYPVFWRSPQPCTVQALAADLECMVRHHANHPSVVIFDAQNETDTDVTRQAAQVARRADLSDRPWDLGWDRPALRPDDVFESHPYLIQRDDFRLESLSSWSPQPEEARLPKDGRTGNPGNNPVIINEYSYLWINRDGSLPTLCLDNPVLEKVGSTNDAPVEHRRDAMSYGISCLTGFWRMHRTVAGVMHFCSLTYSLPHGQTCDNFIDLEKLELEPTFARLVRASFAPVAAVLDNWGRPHCAGFPYTGHIVLLNDLTVPWQGEVWLRLRRRQDRTLLSEISRFASVDALAVERFTLTLPGPAQPGEYLLEAELAGADGECVTCERRFHVPNKFEGRFWC